MSIKDKMKNAKPTQFFDKDVVDGWEKWLNTHDKQIRVDAIDEYSSKLWQVIEKATVNCKLDFTIDDLHNLEIIIKGLAEELKEEK